MSAPPKPWPTGTAEEIAPLVRRVLAGNASPFTFTGTQTYLVGGGDGVAVIDPGPDDAAHLSALLAAIGEVHPYPSRSFASGRRSSRANRRPDHRLRTAHHGR